MEDLKITTNKHIAKFQKKFDSGESLKVFGHKYFVVAITVQYLEAGNTILTTYSLDLG